MPGGKRRVFAEAHGKEALADGEQSLQHLADGEVGAQVFLREGVLALPLFFRGVGDVPRLKVGQRQLACGVGAQRRHVRFARRLAFGDEVFEESDDRRAVRRHFVIDGIGGIVGKAEQFRQLKTQGEGFADDGGVVVLAVVGEFAGTDVVGAIDGGAQLAVIGVGKDGDDHRRVEGDAVAVFAMLAGEVGH